MKHRDRVAMALRHEAPDRCPMQISFTPEFAARLRQSMGESCGVEHNPHGGGNPYDLEIALDQDMLLTSVGWANSYYQGKQEYVDEWGVAWHAAEYTTPFGKGYYTEFHSPPLADDAAIDLLSEKGFDPIYGARPLRRAIQNAVEDAAAEKILEGRIKEGDKVTVTVLEGKIELITGADTKEPAKAGV